MRRLTVEAFLVVEPSSTDWRGNVWSARIAKMTKRVPKNIRGDARVVRLTVDLPASLLERPVIGATYIVPAVDA